MDSNWSVLHGPPHSHVSLQHAPGSSRKHSASVGRHRRASSGSGRTLAALNVTAKMKSDTKRRSCIDFNYCGLRWTREEKQSWWTITLLYILQHPGYKYLHHDWFRDRTWTIHVRIFQSDLGQLFRTCPIHC
jgi:hypothetical protein